MRVPRFLLVVTALLATAGPLSAQASGVQLPLAPSDTVYEVRVQDGSILYGQVVEAGAERLVLLTSAGLRIELSRAQIRSVAPIRGTVRPDGEVWLADPNSTRLFFGPTGRSLRRGDGYVGAFELSLPFVAYGLTDRITIAGGTPIVPEVLGRVVYLAPRVQVVRTDRLHLSAGILSFFDLTDNGDGDPDHLGVVYGAGTVGSADNALSFGAGWGVAGSDIQGRPAMMLGGEARVSRRIKLITESYLFSYEEDEYDFETDTYREGTAHAGVLGLGVRMFGERLAGDLGLGVGFGDSDFACCIPLVNFVYNFGRR